MVEHGVYDVRMRGVHQRSPHADAMPLLLVVQEEFDKVVAERGMAAKLNRLDALLESRELVEGQTL